MNTAHRKVDENDLSLEDELEVLGKEARTTLVKMRRVNKNYKLGSVTVPALKNIDLALQSNELVAVHGPSGSGKSTLMNLIGLTDRDFEGEIAILDEDVSKMTENQLAEFRNRNIGFIFQGFNLIPTFNALENIMLPLQIAREKGNVKNKAMDMLDQVGLKDKFNVKPDQLSGGQQQRVAIARALIMSPKIVLADEPTANLDGKSTENIMRLMYDLRDNFNTSFLVSTHDTRVLNITPKKIELVDGCVTA